MQQHIFYRITSYILLPIAAILAFISVMVLMIALSNPPLLLPVFIVACVAIYVFCSFSFFNKGVLKARPCKRSLKDWIKVNAIVSIIFCVILIMNVMAMIAQPQLLSQALDQSLAMQGNPPQVSKAEMLEAAKGMMYFLGVFAVLLFIHIIISFRLLKQYGYVFEDPTSGTE